jgi:hypothetical protein
MYETPESEHACSIYYKPDCSVGEVAAPWNRRYRCLETKLLTVALSLFHNQLCFCLLDEDTEIQSSMVAMNIASAYIGERTETIHIR